jgi:hypothetical protein
MIGGANIFLLKRYRASERFIFRVVGLHRSTQRHHGKVINLEEARLRHPLWEITAELHTL